MQNLVNDLSDRVSALTADVSRIQTNSHANAMAWHEAEAVIRALSEALVNEFWNHDNHDLASASREVVTIIEDARAEHRTKTAQES